MYKDDKSNFACKSMLFTKFNQAHAALGRGICHLLWWLFLQEAIIQELCPWMLYISIQSRAKTRCVENYSMENKTLQHSFAVDEDKVFFLILRCTA